MKYYQVSLWVIGTFLQVLVLSALIRGALKKFPFVFIYSITLFFTTAVEIAAAMDVGIVTKLSWSYFWTDEFLRQSTIFAIVISLIYRATPKGPRRMFLARWFALGAVAIWLGSLYFCYDKRYGFWMTGVVRNLSFCSAVMNFLLWGKLLASRDRDPQLLMISGGLGLQMAGEAIGSSLRQSWHSTWLIGSTISVLTSFLCSWIWWLALRRESVPDVSTASIR